MVYRGRILILLVMTLTAISTRIYISHIPASQGKNLNINDPVVFPAVHSSVMNTAASRGH